MSSASTRERTERTRMLSRTSVTSIGLSCALADDLELDLGVDRPAHLLDRLVQGQALHLLVVEMGDDVVGQDARVGRPAYRRSARPP